MTSATAGAAPATTARAGGVAATRFVHGAGGYASTYVFLIEKGGKEEEEEDKDKIMKTEKVWLKQSRKSHRQNQDTITWSKR